MPAGEDGDPVVLSPRYTDAVGYIADVTAGPPRKGTRIPSLSRLLAVSALVLEDGGDEDIQRQAAAPPVTGGGGKTIAQTPAPPRQHRDATRHTITVAVTPALVRRWAQQQGIQVADRGRIPRSVMEQYLAGTVAHSGKSPHRRGSTARRPRSGRRPSAA